MSCRNTTAAAAAAIGLIFLTQATAAQDSFEFRFAFGTVCG